jgi:two-component system cell cycle response regulator
MAGPATILIVDDEPKNIDYLEQELEGFGYSTVSASNGAEALTIVQTNAPSLILLDVMMPVMDGFETCSILKASDETRFIPVIIMTALDAVEGDGKIDWSTPAGMGWPQRQLSQLSLG